jgi:hypothetical protein
MQAIRLRRGRTPALVCFSLALALSACGGDDGEDGSDSGDQADGADDGTDDGDGAGEVCAAPEYGDGTCDTSIDCAAPDIDCFRFFDSQSEAETWFASFEERLAMEEFREPRAIVPATDPRFAQMRDLLDRGWAAYQETNPVGDLAAQSPALIIIEDPTVNAFVIPDLETRLAGFAVIVQTGLLAQDATDQAMLGLVMHELQHVVGLHIVGDVSDQLRRFYIAAGDEPFGFEQAEEATAREHGTAWRALAEEAGPYPLEELGGLPFGSSQLDQILNTVLSSIEQPDAEPCAAPLATWSALFQDLASRVSPLDSALLLDGPVRAEVDAALAGLRDECLFDFPSSFVDVVARISGATPEEVRASLSEEDLALVEGVHVIDAIAALMIDRRARMRDIEVAFADAAAQPWSAIRFYSYEEAADDATVPVLHAMELPADGLGDFLFDAQPAAARPDCSALLDGGDTPPYGADLADEHHATCWRVHHVRDLAASGVLTGAALRPSAARRAPVARRRPLPIPPRLSDLVMY